MPPNDWVHSRDFSMWLNRVTGKWEKYDGHGGMLEKGNLGKDTDPRH